MKTHRKLLYVFSLIAWLATESLATESIAPETLASSTLLKPLECQPVGSGDLSSSPAVASSVAITRFEHSLMVSNREFNEPVSIFWQIGRSDPEAVATDPFQDLAIPLSQPQRAIIRWCEKTCVARDVLLFGGGYDPVFDSLSTPVSHSSGNAIYLVDTVSGELIWSAGAGNHHDLVLTTLTHSIVADLSVIDSDGDCFADTVFAIDIVGNLFRFDFVDDPSTEQAIATGGLIAEIGGGAHYFRRFFNAPDIAWFSPENGDPFFTIAIASGNHRNQWATDVSNYLFVIFDPHVLLPPGDYAYTPDNTIITPANLFLAGDDEPSAMGWYLPLSAAGEKALQATVTFENRIFLSTIIPHRDSRFRFTNLSGRAYLLDAITGRSHLQQISNGELVIRREGSSTSQSLPFYSLNHIDTTDRLQLLSTTKPACDTPCGEPFPDLGNYLTTITPCVGNNCIPVSLDQELHKIFWRSEP